MTLPVKLRTHLAAHPGNYRGRSCRPAASLEETARGARIPLEKLAKAVLLKTGKVRLLAVVPACNEPDLQRLGKAFKRTFAICSPEETRQQFPDCDPGAIPPFGLLYGVKTIVDAGLDGLDDVFFPSGVRGQFVRIDGKRFDQLLHDAWRGRRIVEGHTPRPAKVPAPAVADPSGSPEDLRRRVKRVGKLPAMPGIATQIIRLRSNPFASASELAAIIEQDPSLSAQLLRYASSPFYAYQGKVERVEQAIVRVLGMDFVMEFAFGLALGRPFRNPKEGPLGLDAFWNHAVYSASLAQKLCSAIEYSRRPHAGLAYLAGLLHNFGFLLLGHMFRPQFDRLNKALAGQPERSTLELEREVLGVAHTELGVWLMEAWEMPREIIETVREHHNPDYRSDYSDYANLVCLADQLLRRLGIGDADSMEISPSLLEVLGLNEMQAEAALGTVLGGRENLEFIARKMAA